MPLYYSQLALIPMIILYPLTCYEKKQIWIYYRLECVFKIEKKEVIIIRIVLYFIFCLFYRSDVLNLVCT
uniref:Uncharacterized protein n=1 Tax=Lepeophtheirus salmonis TaxID=72036 RepID=A0A0K2TD95_LEPSM